jgi:hypothetical protein
MIAEQRKYIISSWSQKSHIVFRLYQTEDSNLTYFLNLWNTLGGMIEPAPKIYHVSEKKN